MLIENLNKEQKEEFQEKFYELFGTEKTLIKDWDNHWDAPYGRPWECSDKTDLPKCNTIDELVKNYFLKLKNELRKHYKDHWYDLFAQSDCDEEKKEIDNYWEEYLEETFK